MENKPKITLTYTLMFAIGILTLFIGILFQLRTCNFTGICLLVAGIALITFHTELLIDYKTSHLIYSQKIGFIRVSLKKIKIASDKGFIELIDSSNELFGINKRPSTFFTYDVIYRKANNNKIHLFTSTNSNKAYKVAEFLSKNLNLPLDSRSIKR